MTFGEGEQPGESELVPVAVARLGDSVAEEQEAVAGFEELDGHLVRRARNSQRQPPPGGEAGHRPAVAQQYRWGMSRVDVPQFAGVQVQFGEHGGDETEVVELAGYRL